MEPSVLIIGGAGKTGARVNTLLKQQASPPGRCRAPRRSRSTGRARKVGRRLWTACPRLT